MKKVLYFEESGKIIAKGVILKESDKKIVEVFVKLFQQTNFSLEGIIINCINSHYKYFCTEDRGDDIAKHLIKHDMFSNLIQSSQMGSFYCKKDIITFEINNITLCTDSKFTEHLEYNRDTICYKCDKSSGNITKRFKRTQFIENMNNGGFINGFNISIPDEVVKVLDILVDPSVYKTINQQEQQIEDIEDKVIA